MKNQGNQEINLSKYQINDEIGLGRNRTEMSPTPTGIIQQTQAPTIEEEAIFEELGLGKISHPNGLIEQNDNDDYVS